MASVLHILHIVMQFSLLFAVAVADGVGPLDWQCRLWSWPKLDDPWLRGHDLNGSSIVSCGDNFI